jgi:glucosyl-dolichyl phosphate glucuronosyltransferase
MKLDVVLPTFNRSKLLSRTLDSLMRARIPAELDVTVFVVDNNSKDDTRAVVQSYQDRWPILRYIVEREQGSSAALNAGIRAGCGELIATLNDDEEVDVRWFEVIRDFALGHPEFAFAGGPYRPNWSQKKPNWITKDHFGAVIGWVDAGDRAGEYGVTINGMPMAGNAVFRRFVFDRVGLYNTSLGRFDKGLSACEDEDMFHRLTDAKLRGVYLPDLVIFHYVPPERMTRTYYRKWCLGRGTSHGKLCRNRRPDVAAILGIPRWEIRRALVGVSRAILGLFGRVPAATAFSGELYAWDLLGFIKGRFF